MWRRSDQRSGVPARRAQAGLAVVIAALVFLTAAGHSAIVERIIAVVNEEPILLTDLERMRAFGRVPPILRTVAAIGAAEGELEGLRTLIHRRLLVAEARRLEIPCPEATVVAQSIEMLRERVGGEQALARALLEYGMSDDALANLLADDLLVERFLDRRIYPFVRISPLEIEKAMSDFPERFIGVSGDERLNIAEDLVKTQKAGERLRGYLSRLTVRARIRINPLSFPPAPASAG